MAQRPNPRPAGGDSPRGDWRTAGRKATPAKRDTKLYTQTSSADSGIWWKRVLSLGLVFVLVLVFIAVIRWIPRSTPLVVVSVTNYAAPAPPNAWAKEDAQAFFDAWPLAGAWKDYWNNVVVEVVDKPPPSAKDFVAAALAPLDKHPAGGPKKNVRLLYISAHGLVNEAGEPCLLLPNERDNAYTTVWPNKSGELPLLPVSQLVDELRTRAKSGRTKYVVLLEANRLDSQWRLGMLDNEFAARLGKYMNDTAADDSVVVLNSVSPGELSQAYPEYGASGFGMLVKAGLLGAADADGNKRVRLHELRDYLAKNVDVLARQGRYRTQTPELLPEKAADFDLAFAQNDGEDPLAASKGLKASDLEDKWNDTYSLWQMHAQLAKVAEQRSGSLTIERLPSYLALEQGLLRLDQLCDAGSAYSDEFQLLTDKLDKLVTSLLEVANKGAGNGSSVEAGALLKAVNTAEAEAKVEAQKKWNEIPLAAQQEAVWQWLAGSTDPTIDAGLLLLTATAAPAQIAKEPAGIRTLRRYRSEGYLPPDIASNHALLGKMLALRNNTDEFASGAGDLRAQYVAMPYVDAVDAARRAGEDRLFVGDVSGVDAELTKASGLDNTIHDSKQLALWLKLRDAAWHELPYYADWTLALERETPSSSADSAKSERYVAAVRRAIGLNARLTTALEWLTEAARGQASTTDQAALTKQTGELATALQGEMEVLRTAFDNATKTCATGALDRANLAQILRLLRVPLQSAARQTLREHYVTILAKTREQSTGKAAEHAASAADSPGDLITAAVARATGPHPGALLWEIGQRYPVSTAGLKLDELSPTFEIPAGAAKANTISTIELEKHLQTIRDLAATSERSALSGNDEACRTLLAFTTLPPTFGEPETGLGQPQQKLSDFDRHHYLVWQAERTLDDFWGSADAPPSAAALGDYFALVADGHLQEASRLYSNQSQPLRAAQQKLALRKQAAQELLSQVVAADIHGKPIEGARTFERSIHWPDGELKGRVNNLPPGAAALYAQNSGGSRGTILLRQAGDGSFKPEIKQALYATGEQGAVLPAKLEFEFRDEASASVDSTFDLVFYYRGHADRQLVGVGKLVPATVVVWDKPRDQRPQVVLQGEVGPDKNLGSVAILLDCSHSMDEKFAAGASRMKVALSALGEITRELENAGNKNFTVWLFGHRRYMPTNDELDDRRYNLGGGRFRTPWNTAFGATDDPTIHFHNDVQRVWPTDKGPALRDLLNPEQAYIRPWGRTALYTAMYQALVTDLAKRDKTAPRRMIVLSDGDNFVRNDNDLKITYVPAWDYKKDEDKSAADLIGALKTDFGDQFDQRVRLHVVDLSGGAASRIKTDKIVETVSGSFHTAADLEQLKRVLKEAAGLYQYAIYDDTRQDYVFRNVPINTVKEFESYEGRKFSVRLEGSPSNNNARFALAGGEKLAYGLKYESGFPRVVPLRPRFEESLTQTVANPARTSDDDDFSPKEFRVALIEPRRFGSGDVEFRIAVQNQQAERFSPRPRSAWIEIEPGNRVDGEWQPAGAKYVFSDLAFEADQSVPVLRQVARSWPRAAKEARVQAWFSLQEWPSSSNEQLRKLRVGSADDEENFKLKPPGFSDNLRCAVQIVPRAEGGSQVIVTQLSDSTSAPALRIKLSREPDMIRRQYYQAPHAGRVVNVFEYHTVAPDALLDEFIDIQTLEKLVPIAAHLKEPVVIGVRDK